MGDILQFPTDEADEFEISLTDDDEGQSLMAALSQVVDGRPFDNTVNALTNLVVGLVTYNVRGRSDQTKLLEHFIGALKDCLDAQEEDSDVLN